MVSCRNPVLVRSTSYTMPRVDEPTEPQPASIVTNNTTIPSTMTTTVQRVQYNSNTLTYIHRPPQEWPYIDTMYDLPARVRPPIDQTCSHQPSIPHTHTSDGQQRQAGSMSIRTRLNLNLNFSLPLSVRHRPSLSVRLKRQLVRSRSSQTYMTDRLRETRAT